MMTLGNPNRFYVDIIICNVFTIARCKNLTGAKFLPGDHLY